jgi:hypothetical protein
MTFPLRSIRARSPALNTTSQGETPMRRSRSLIAVSAVSAAILMLVATVGPASASFWGAAGPGSMAAAACSFSRTLTEPGLFPPMLPPSTTPHWSGVARRSP